MSHDHSPVDQVTSNQLPVNQSFQTHLARLNVGKHDPSTCKQQGFASMRQKSHRTNPISIQFNRYRIEFPGPQWIVELQPSRTSNGARRCRGKAKNQIEYRTALGRQDLESAFKLLHRRYCAAGLSSAFSQSLRILPFHYWPQTQVFVAIKNAKILGCITLITDQGHHPLPIASIYPESMASLDQQGERTGELCCLAIDAGCDESSSKVFGELTRRAMFFARLAGLTRVAAVVHPRHAKFYQQAMGSEIIGEVARHAHVEGNPGVPILGRVSDPEAYRKKWRDFYFDGSFPVREIDRHPMSQIDQEYFRRYQQLPLPARKVA